MGDLSNSTLPIVLAVCAGTLLLGVDAASDEEPSTLRLSEVGFDEGDLLFSLEDAGTRVNPERLTVRRVDLVASLLAGFDPTEHAPAVSSVRFDGPVISKKAAKGKELECDASSRRRCRIKGMAPSESGAYWVAAFVGKEQAYALIVEAAGEFVVRGDTRRVAVWGADDSGTPFAGAHVVAIRRGRILGKGTLGGDGALLLDLKAAPPRRTKAVSGRKARSRRSAAKATAADALDARAADPMWVRVFAPDGAPRDALFAIHLPEPAEPKPVLQVILDRPAYRPGDPVRLFAAVSYVPPGLRKARLRFDGAEKDGSPSVDWVTAPLSDVGTVAATLKAPALPPGAATLRIKVGETVLTTEVPIVTEDARVDAADTASPGTLAGPVRLGVDETLRHAGTRWTRGLEVDGGLALIRAVPLPTFTRATVAGSELVDPGHLAAYPVLRRVPLSFHSDIRYEIPYASLTAAGGPAITYIDVVERGGGDAPTKARRKAAKREGLGSTLFAHGELAVEPLWQLATYVEGKLSAPPVSVPEPSRKVPVAVGTSYVRAGERLPIRARPGGSSGGLLLLEDGGIRAIVPFGERTPALSMPDSPDLGSPRVVCRIVGRSDEPFGLQAPVLPGRRFLGIDLEVRAGSLVVYVYDDIGKKVRARVTLVAHLEASLPPLSRWESPAVALYSGMPIRARDGERLRTRHYGELFGGLSGIGIVSGLEAERDTASTRGLPPAAPLVWKTDVDVDGSASVSWKAPPSGSLVRVDVFGVGAGRAGRRVFMLPVD